MAAKLNRIRPHEAALIVRRRLGHTQRRRAEMLRVEYTDYCIWEQGTFPSAVDIYPQLRSWFTHGRSLTLRPHECCLLLRRRAGLTLADMAQEMHRSKMWVGLMERGQRDPKELVAHWAKR